MKIPESVSKLIASQFEDINTTINEITHLLENDPDTASGFGVLLVAQTVAVKRMVQIVAELNDYLASSQ